MRYIVSLKLNARYDNISIRFKKFTFKEEIFYSLNNFIGDICVFAYSIRLSLFRQNKKSLNSQGLIYIWSR